MKSFTCSVVAALAVCAGACSSQRPAASASTRHPGGGTATLQAGSPAWIVDHMYAYPDFPEQNKYITGEFARRFGGMPTIGSTLKPGVKVSSPRAIGTTDSTAIYSTAIGDSGKQIEWYTYLVRDLGQWRVEAVRTLEFPKVFYVMYDSLRAGKKIPDAPPQMQQIMALSMASDADIQKYFVDHQGAMQAVVDAFNKTTLPGVDLSDSAAVAARRGSPLPNDREAPVRALLEQAGVSTVFHEKHFPNCTFVRIGGIAHTQVGYLYAPAGCKVPNINPLNFIYVAKIRDSWYEYKLL